MMRNEEHKATEELHCLRRLAKEAPKMTVGAAQRLAATYAEYFANMMDYSAALGILAETSLGFTENGAIPPDTSRRFAIEWALKQAQYCHSFCACGPVPIEALLEEKDNLNLNPSPEDE